MHVSWIVMSRGGFELDDRLALNEYFKIKRNPGFLKPIGVASPRSYRPWLISPQIDVWQELERKINKETKSTARGRSSVLYLRDYDGQPERRYGFTLRLYRPNLVCIEIRCLDRIDADVEAAFSVRSIEGHPAARVALDILLGIVLEGDIKGYKLGNSFFAKPSFIFDLGIPKEEFLSWREMHKSAIVGLLINNQKFQLADEGLAQSLIDRNKDVDIKYEKAALSLVSKQGILTAYSSVDTDFERQVRREHEKRTRFLEFATAIQQFAHEFTGYRAHDKSAADFLLYLVLPYMEENAHLAKSVTGTFTWSILSKEIGLSKMIEHIPLAIIENIAKKEHLFLQIPEEKFDSLDYKTAVISSTRWYTKEWIIRDFAGSKILPWFLATIFAITTLIMTFLKIKAN